MLEIKNLQVNIGQKKIINDLNLALAKGSVEVIMGPNGSGKSTLANVILGNPKFSVESGKIFFLQEELTPMPPEDRAKRGLFMSWQYPREIAGVPFNQFLFLSYNEISKWQNPAAAPVSVFEFEARLKLAASELKIKPELLSRSLNFGFSGGEKKKMEMLQLAILQPRLAILDETDSGLDIDALKIIAQAINQFRSAERSVLLITHYNRILQYLRPDRVHIMINGRIVKSGDGQLAEQIEKYGYQEFS